MGITQSNTPSQYASPSEQAALESTKPRFARLYHSWFSYVLFFFQLVLGIMTGTMLFGWFQTNSTVTLISFICIMWVFYLAAFLTNYAWYSATFMTRRHLGIEREECLKICRDAPTYSVVIARDLKFHSDQTHFSWGLLVYSFILIGMIAFLALAGTANPSPDFNVPPPVYNAVANDRHLIIKLVQAMVIAVAGAVGLLMLKTESCFLHDTLVSLNNEMLSGDLGRGLRTPTERQMPTPNLPYEETDLSGTLPPPQQQPQPQQGGTMSRVSSALTRAYPLGTVTY